ncbi:MAG: spondin domain-containing protein [Anaeromyxobacteraceae bacterium]
MKPTTLLLALSLTLTATAARGGDDAAQYRVVFTGAWTAASHPLEYPKAGLLTGPHFSGLIGATHARGWELFMPGALPTPGLERLSEEGKHSPLDAEIRAAISAGKAGTLFETGPIRDMTRTETVVFRVDAAHPLVSAVAMIAPSPDWFAGAADVDLREGGRWVEAREVVLYAYDAGSDDGTTYEAPDQDATPKHPTALNDSPHFKRGGERVPVGKLTFTRVGDAGAVGSR